MDGYHLYRHQLNHLSNPAEAHARRGAPFTFDAERFVEDIVRAKHTGEGLFPGFDHGRGDPVENAVRLEQGRAKFVLVEGNYLLLSDEPWCRLWKEVLDETWFLSVPIEVCRERVYRRHLATGKSEQEARTRVDTNDAPNAELVNRVCPGNADRIIVPETGHAEHRH